MLFNLSIYIVSFVFVWVGAGLIVSSASKFSKRLRVSSFAFSFVVLGLLTSIPEFSVGLQAVANHDPEIFVGNLLGGIIVLLLLVIPLLAIFGNGIHIKHQLGNKAFLLTLGVILTPSIFVLDRQVTNLESVVMILLYLILLFVVQIKHGIFDKKETQLLNIKAYSYKDLLKIIVGIVVVFVSSSLIVDKTVYFANLLGISAFYISLIIVALGTDLPEILLTIRSVLSGTKDIAIGDLIGAASASTLLFGILTLLNHGEILTISNFLITFLFMVTALCLFYFFSAVKGGISRLNGIFLIMVYILFLIVELRGSGI